MRNMLIALRSGSKAWSLLTVSILLLPWDLGYGQRRECEAENYWLRTQADIEAFPGDCAVILGNLWIGPSNQVADLSRLSRLTKIRGDLVVTGIGFPYRRAERDLDGLSRLQSVGGDLEIRYNHSLINIDGLSALKLVGRNIVISDNELLVSLDGLSGLTGVGGDVTISDNAALMACSCGVYACVSGGYIEGHVTMKDNAVSSDCNYDGEDLVPSLCPSTVTATEQKVSILPTTFALHPNYPNPFNPSTTITYDVPKAAQVRLMVYEALGRTVEELSTKHHAPGTYAATWSPRAVPSGVYFVRMQAGTFTQTQRMILTK